MHVTRIQSLPTLKFSHTTGPIQIETQQHHDAWWNGHSQLDPEINAKYHRLNFSLKQFKTVYTG